ncbi:DNA-processing protein DprA [Undibacterium sp. TJN25]|uniref:DNA-processing protein DprA n=1 Tax=Undibacterium sp. TJN25 TaxID=3413056 RepID=UPI003BF19C3F
MLASENGNTAELADWIRLEQTPGVGQETARKLLAAFGLPAQIFAAGFTALRSVVPDRIALPLSEPITPQIQAQIARTLDWCAQPGNQALTLADAGYPPALLNIPDPPVILYVKGRAALLEAASIAVVGSRNATVQGVGNAEKFSESLSKGGWTIVSGLAVGIDAAAHHGGLRGPGSTVAVIGTGADIVYPARNRALAHLIAEGGCIVSEYPLGMPAIAANFPRRNRIISGLAKGVLVVEAAAQSGSLITARMAAEQGREVFAIPGSIHSPLAKGCHLLIKQGAKLVESAQDILDELLAGPALPVRKPPAQLALVESDHPLLALMGYDPAHIDTLALRSGLDIAELNTQLLNLELDGIIEHLPGANYRRIA